MSNNHDYIVIKLSTNYVTGSSLYLVAFLYEMHKMTHPHSTSSHAPVISRLTGRRHDHLSSFSKLHDGSGFVSPRSESEMSCIWDNWINLAYLKLFNIFRIDCRWKCCSQFNRRAGIDNCRFMGRVIVFLKDKVGKCDLVCFVHDQKLFWGLLKGVTVEKDDQYFIKTREK